MIRWPNGTSHKNTRQSDQQLNCLATMIQSRRVRARWETRLHRQLFYKGTVRNFSLVLIVVFLWSWSYDQEIIETFLSPGTVVSRQMTTFDDTMSTMESFTIQKSQISDIPTSRENIYGMNRLGTVGKRQPHQDNVKTKSNQIGMSDDGISQEATVEYSDTPPIGKTNHRIRNGRYCEWKQNHTLHDCHAMLTGEVQSKLNWYFFGDSTMRYVFEGLMKQSPPTSYQRSLSKCDALMYFGFPKGRWVEPNSTKGEGPVHDGLDRPFCTDTSGGFNILIKQAGERQIEYLVVEFARDVAIPTPWTRTTQETVTLYMKNKNLPRSDTVCVVNTGMHDISIHGMTASLYATNVNEYISLLKPYCGTIIWIGLSATENWEDYPQQNDLIDIWNNALYDMLDESHPDVFILDVWDKSMTTKHADNIHLDPEAFYDHLGHLFFHLGT